MRKIISTAAAVFLFAGAASLAMAQDSHDSHHPAGDQPPAAAPAAPPSSGAPSSGAQSGGMMMGGQGMMGRQGMMGGDGMSMPMMQMMMNMMGPRGMSEMAMPGMDMADHVEGRIAFLHAELKITDAQTKAWNDFAQTLRDSAKKLGGMRSMMGQQTETATPTLAQRLDQQEQWYTARADGIRTLKITFAHLYGALSDEQKKTADQILAPHLGLMPMAAMPMGMMSMGGPSAGGMPGRAMPKAKP